MSRAFAVVIPLLISALQLSYALPLDSFEERIVNGTEAADGEYPFMVSLRFNGGHTCGATLLDENWVLTAAHCVEGRDWANFSVEVGSNQLDDETIPLIPLSEVIIHEEYDPDLVINDVAVLKLVEPVTYSDKIQPTTLPELFQETAGGTPATVIGWGLPYTDGDVMNDLQTVDIFVVSDELCAAAYSRTVDGYPVLETNICGAVPEGGKGQCNGDSGGPLLVEGTQVGIVSWSEKPCTIQGYPGVYTQVSYYVDWILENAQ